MFWWCVGLSVLLELLATLSSAQKKPFTTDTREAHTVIFGFLLLILLDNIKCNFWISTLLFPVRFGQLHSGQVPWSTLAAVEGDLWRDCGSFPDRLVV